MGRRGLKLTPSLSLGAFSQALLCNCLAVSCGTYNGKPSDVIARKQKGAHLEFMVEAMVSHELRGNALLSCSVLRRTDAGKCVTHTNAVKKKIV